MLDSVGGLCGGGLRGGRQSGTGEGGKVDDAGVSNQVRGKGYGMVYDAVPLSGWDGDQSRLCWLCTESDCTRIMARGCINCHGVLLLSSREYLRRFFFSKGREGPSFVSSTLS